MASWEDFVIQAVATLLGVMWGIPTALWLNSKYSTYQEEERKILLRNLKENLEDNLRLLNDMERDFGQKQVVFYHLNLGLWSFISEKIYLIDNIDLRKEILHIYYSLEHLSRKIDKQYEIHYSSFRMAQTYVQEREQFILIIMMHLGIIKKEIEGVLKEIPIDKINK